MAKSVCSLEYHTESFETLPDTATGVKTGWFGNTGTFAATAPVTQTVYEGHIATYNLKYSAYKRGGEDQKGPFLLAKADVLSDMDLFSIAVDARANGNEDIIILGGFIPTKVTRTASSVPGVAVVTVGRGEASRMVVAECKVVPGAEFYGALLTTKELANTAIREGQLVIDPADAAFIIRIDVNKKRKKQFNALIKGNEYFVYYFAGNTAGVGQLSNVQGTICG